MPSRTPPLLSEDEIDDILYFSRAGEFSDFKTAIEAPAKRLHAPPHDILLAAVDESSGNGALHMASANGHTGPFSHVLYQFLTRRRLTIAAELLAYALSLLPTPNTAAAASRAILESQNAAGNTSLHWAALNGHLQAVKALVKAGADPSVTNGAGHDVVFEAEVAGREEVVEWLLVEGKGLDVVVKGRGGEGDGMEEEEGTGEGLEEGEGVEEGDGTDEVREEVESMEIGEGTG